MSKHSSNQELPPLPARASNDGKRWICGVQTCPGTLATLEEGYYFRGADHVSSCLKLPERFDFDKTRGIYFKNRRPARRFSEMYNGRLDDDTPLKELEQRVRTKSGVGMHGKTAEVGK